MPVPQFTLKHGPWQPSVPLQAHSGTATPSAFTVPAGPHSTLPFVSLTTFEHVPQTSRMQYAVTFEGSLLSGRL